MIISDLAVKQRISVLVLCVIIIVWGAYAYFALPRESAPDITIPHVFVSTNYRGVSPADIETSITIPIEKKLKGLKGVKKIKSVSAEGQSSIDVEFVTGTDIDQALQRVKDKVDESRSDLPSDIEEDPSVYEVNFSEFPILVLSLSSDIGLARLKRIADDLKEDIEAIPGVLECEVSGGLEREIRIEPYPERLSYYGIPLTSLQHIITGENQNVSGGIIKMGDGRFRLSVPGEFSMPDEILHLVIGTHNGQPVYLKDVAAVIDGFKEQESRSRLNGRDAVNLSVKKRTGENIIAISDRIDEIIEKAKSGWPDGVTLTKLMDNAKEIRLMLADLENNLISGLILVVLVILFSMGLRNALIISTSIPFSMLISFTILHVLGITLNMIVLFSLTMAVGMLVDNAIIVIENIYRFMEQGVPRIHASMMATSEVAYPVISATLTTVAAFIPLMFWPGIMGEFMKYLPITLMITISSSLFASLVINPAIGSLLMKSKKLTLGRMAVTAEEIIKAGEQPVSCDNKILKGYRRTLEYCLRHRLAVLAFCLVTLVICIQFWFLKVGIKKPVEFFPYIDPKGFYINMKTPEGAGLDFIDKIAKQVEIKAGGGDLSAINDGKASVDTLFREAMRPKTHKRLNGATFEAPGDLDNIKHIYARATTMTGGGFSFGENTPNHIGIQLLDIEDRIQPSPQTLELVRKRMTDIPGAEITTTEREEGPPTGAPINIEIVGEDFQILGTLSEHIKDMVSRIPYVKDVTSDYMPGYPSIRLKVDRQKAALLGLSTDTIGFVLKTAFNGLQISTYYEADEDYDITIQLSERDRQSTDILKHLLIPSPIGELVPLSTVAKFSYTGSIGDITRINNERVVTVKANVEEEFVPGPIARGQAEELLSKFTLPPGYKIRFTGEFEFQKESEDFLKKAFVVAILLIFLILVIQFNSIPQSLIIMTTVIFSLGGVFLGLACFDFSFGIIMTGVAVISLAGVVVNNATVLIDYINQLKKRGLTSRDAIAAAGCTRVRSIYLTTITTLLGLIPMLTGVSYDFHKWQIAWISESSQWWQNMASAFIFGLGFATILTLLLVPVLYSINESLQYQMSQFAAWSHDIYWRPFYRIFGKGSKE